MSVAVSTGDLSGGGLVTLVSTFTKPNIQCPATNSCDCTDHPPRHATLPTLFIGRSPKSEEP